MHCSFALGAYSGATFGLHRLYEHLVAKVLIDHTLAIGLIWKVTFGKITLQPHDEYI